ncbi:hypothetical protein IU449_05090 [Nocardia higoensis]|uniref:EfeO-type cupredoxin-like domain-containing protein n=1 Tax=Nocardia higoensis TaxID=228599 RepID=A0ABS0D761_9NOCA|nr:hypothetical protein [Nocardia higoensis]MBF6353930.1 hypothetical protein [Nocardia higoensis]
MTRRSGRCVPARSAPAALALAVLVTAVCALTGCGSDSSRGEGAALVDATATDHGGNAVTVDIRIAGGSVTPVNARAEAHVGEPVTLVIDSDTDDELHIHATPEHTFTVRAGADQRFTFAVDVPGRVDVELHRAKVTVTTIYVRP